MANAVHDQFAEFDFARARWMIDIFDEACHDLTDQPPTEEQRNLLAAGIVKAAEFYGCRDRLKLKEAALRYLRASQHASDC